MFNEYRHLTRCIDTDIFYPSGTLCLKVHRNGELSLSENTVYPLRIPGYELLKTKLKILADDVEDRILEGFSGLFLRDKYKNFKFATNDLEKISLESSRDMLERYFMRVQGSHFMSAVEREEQKKWSLEKNRDKNLHDSLLRSKKSLIDYAFNNQWTHFATFTVNSELCDRNSLAACNKKIGTMPIPLVSFANFTEEVCSQLIFSVSVKNYVRARYKQTGHFQKNVIYFIGV